MLTCLSLTLMQGIRDRRMSRIYSWEVNYTHSFKIYMFKIQMNSISLLVRRILHNHGKFNHSKKFSFDFSKGDSAYTLLPFLMKIVPGDNLTAAEMNYNEIILSVRHLIERVIGLLKVRFRCTLGERKLRYHQTKASKIIYTCATLHNFLIRNRFNIMHGIDPNELMNVINNHRALHVNAPLNRNVGVARRNELIALLR